MFTNMIHPPEDQLTGCLERSCDCGSYFPVYERDNALIERRFWKDFADDECGLEPYVSRIFNQGREGSCASNATAQAMEIVTSQQIGKDQSTRLSAISLYTRVGRNANSGSSIPSNIQEVAERGLLPLNTTENKEKYDHTHPATGFSERLPSGWEETAKLFQAFEWFDIQSFDGIATCLLKGFPVVYGRAGHAICGVNLVRRGGEWCIKYANSWGNWGEHGYGYDSEDFVSRSVPSYGAFGVRVVNADYSDVPEAH